MKNLLKTTGALGLTGLCIGLGIYTTTKKPKIHLILDLDETLIHSKTILNEKGPKDTRDKTKNLKAFRKADFSIPDYSVWKRPYSGIMFTVLRPFCNFHLYTSADKDYADDIITRAGWDKHFAGNCRRYYDEAYKANKCKDIDAIDAVDVPLRNNYRWILVDDCEFNDCRHNDCLKKVNYRFIHIPPYKLYNSGDRELLKLSCKVIYEFFTQ